MQQLWVVRSMRTSRIPPSPCPTPCLICDTALPSTSVKRSSFYSHLMRENMREEKGWELGQGQRARLIQWHGQQWELWKISRLESKQKCTPAPRPAIPKGFLSYRPPPPPLPVWSGLLHVCEQQLHFQVARASSRWANVPPQWKLAGLTSQAKEGICICLAAPIIQICLQLEKWCPGQRPASDLRTLLSPRSVPSCCLSRGQAGPSWTPCTLILQSPSTLWLLCQQLDARPGSAGLWSRSLLACRQESCQMCVLINGKSYCAIIVVQK